MALFSLLLCFQCRTITIVLDLIALRLRLSDDLNFFYSRGYLIIFVVVM